MQLAHGQLAAWQAYWAGSYPSFDPKKHAALLIPHKIRLGAYGDPAAVPIEVWSELASLCRGVIGYTHQWRQCNPGFARFCMASCETSEDAYHAHSIGYRTFRTLLPGEDLGRGELLCPASAEAGFRRTCDRCMACNGARLNDRRTSVGIYVHGSTQMIQAYRKRIELRVLDQPGRIALL